MELTNVLKGTVSRNDKLVEALQKVSSPFTKFAAAKAATTRAREQQTHPTLRQPIPLPRVVDRLPTQAVFNPRVPIAPQEADCHAGLVDGSVQIVDGTTSMQGNHKPLTARSRTQFFGAQLQIFEDVTPLQGHHGPPSARPNYISQDKTNKPWQGYNTRSRTTSIMQEAMLACIDITKPQFKISPANIAAQNFPMTWLCKMANAILGEKGKLLEYGHLIANPKMRQALTHSYGNELGRLAQGMLGRTRGTDTIFFIP